MLSCSAVAKRLCSRCHCAIAGKERHRQFHGRYRRRSGGARRKTRKKGLWRIGINKPIDDSLAVNQELQTILQVTDVGIATSGNYRTITTKTAKKVCPYYRPAHRLSGAAQYPVGHSDCPRLHECRCLCHRFHGHGPGRSRTLCRFTPRPRRMLHICGRKGELRMFYTKGMDKYMTVK